MKPDFSEFSYGYAVTEELARNGQAKVIAAPRFPSLYEEGKKGGYDVKIPFKGKPVFLQFKLSHYLWHSNARELQNGTFKTPYYRMHLRPTRHSDQHKLLLDLENSGEAVFYIAPEFHLPSELNKYYLTRSVVFNSAAFAPKDIGVIPDGKDHYIAFEKQKRYGFFCSDAPKEVRKTALEKGLLAALDGRDVKSRELDEGELQKISGLMLSILEAREEEPIIDREERDIQGIRNIVQDRSTIEGIGYMCRTFFDSELVVLRSEL